MQFSFRRNLVSSKTLTGSSALAALVLLGGTAFGQPPFSSGNPGVPYDWSHHHLVFSQPTTQDQKTKTAADPRYWQQWTYRNLPHNAPDVTPQSDVSGGVESANASANAKKKKPSK